jgi:hypothetical protein
MWLPVAEYKMKDLLQQGNGRQVRTDDPYGFVSCTAIAISDEISVELHHASIAKGDQYNGI